MDFNYFMSWLFGAKFNKKIFDSEKNEDFYFLLTFSALNVVLNFHGTSFNKELFNFLQKNS
jgi:hypothetical protein